MPLEADGQHQAHDELAGLLDGLGFDVAGDVAGRDVERLGHLDDDVAAETAGFRRGELVIRRQFHTGCLTINADRLQLQINYINECVLQVFAIERVPQMFWNIFGQGNKWVLIGDLRPTYFSPWPRNVCAKSPDDCATAVKTAV